MEAGRDLQRMRDYLAGRLSDVDSRAFEDRLSGDPALVRELELSQRLREGLARLRDSGELEVAARRAPSRRWAWGGALAATLAGAALLLVLQPAGRAPAVLSSAVAPASGTAAAFTFVAMRGPAASPVFDLPARGIVELRASRPGAVAASGYHLVLEARSRDGRRVEVGELRGLTAGADGLVHAYADAARLQAGDYQLTVRTEAGSAEDVETFAFSLRNPAR